MRKSWPAARALPRALVLSALVAVFVWLPANGSAGRARVSKLDISPIHADFNSDLRQTTYSVPTVSDPNATYKWRLDITDPLGRVDPDQPLDPDCNNHGNLDGTDKTFVWHHGNAGDPLFDDGCNHGVYGKWGHQGLITVTVRDSQGDQCSATYKGTFSTDENTALGQNAASDGVCTQAPPPVSPPPPPPPPAKPCRCWKLKVSIVPASIKIEDHYGSGDDYSLVKFSLRWSLECTQGSAGKCEGSFTLSGDLASHEIHQQCHGPCGRTSLGRSREHLRYDSFPPAQRAKVGEVPIVIEPFCPRKRRPIKLWIAFTKAGNVDLEKSKLGKP